MIFDTHWTHPPTTLSLTHNDVHVWRAVLDAPAADLEAFWPLLSPDETTRAARFYFPRDRQRFIIARGVLRSILSRYTALPPQTLGFAYGPFGKPLLAPVSGNALLNFNLAHADGLALYTFSRGRAVGIDIVRVDATIAYEQIAARFFSSQEYALLCALPPEQRAAAFFACWARKEAYVKACGTGLSMPLNRFVVSLAPAEPAQLLYTLDDPADATRWAMYDLAPGAGYQAALVVEGHDWQRSQWHWAHDQ